VADDHTTHSSPPHHATTFYHHSTTSRQLPVHFIVIESQGVEARVCRPSFRACRPLCPPLSFPPLYISPSASSGLSPVISSSHRAKPPKQLSLDRGFVLEASSPTTLLHPALRPFPLLGRSHFSQRCNPIHIGGSWRRSDGLTTVVSCPRTFSPTDASRLLYRRLPLFHDFASALPANPPSYRAPAPKRRS
jgi:hypothetical protein